jgi:hypothetical protein
LFFGESGHKADLLEPAIGVEAGGTVVTGCGEAESIHFGGRDVGLVGEITILTAMGDQLLGGD